MCPIKRFAFSVPLLYFQNLGVYCSGTTYVSWEEALINWSFWKLRLQEDGLVTVSLLIFADYFIIIIWIYKLLFACVGGSFHQKDSNITNSQLPKSSFSVAMPSSQCYLTCMPNLIWLFGFYICMLLLYLITNSVILPALPKFRQTKIPMRSMPKWVFNQWTQ